MKSNRIIKISLAICLVLSMIMLPANHLKVQAAEVSATVEGTVLAGTTSELLLLSTREGKMEIKLDSDTDTSACKVLLPDKKVTVSVSHGSDGYLHAVKITSETQAAQVSVDLSTKATVSGTISEKTKGDILYLKTPQGDMEIKLDTTTDMSGCKVLVVDKTYTIVCARGSDAYMHAVSISDGGAGNTRVISGSGLTPAPAGTVTASTTSVTGTVKSSTKEDLLYLSTSGGEMQIVIDSNTDSRNGMVLTPGRTLTVSVYRGSDAYMHAAVITGSRSASQTVEINTSSTSTVSGTVGSKSTENILYLNTPQGEMELKLDGVRSVSNCKVLVEGKKITVTCARGSDAYMHALDISGGETGSTVSGSGLTPAPAGTVTASTTSVTGTVAGNTKENLLYLSTSGGEMQIVIDSNTDSRNGMVLTPGRSLTVSVYRGSDAYMHAAAITGSRSASQAVEINTSSTSTVSGTVGSKSTENVLYLNTPQGEMELKLDAVRSVSNCKVLVEGRKVTVTCARGSDAYMHALDITGA